MKSKMTMTYCYVGANQCRALYPSSVFRTFKQALPTEMKPPRTSLSSCSQHSKHEFSDCHTNIYYMTRTLKFSTLLPSTVAHKSDISIAPREMGFTDIASSHCPLNIFLKLFGVITKNSCCLMV